LTQQLVGVDDRVDGERAARFRDRDPVVTVADGIRAAALYDGDGRKRPADRLERDLAESAADARPRRARWQDRLHLPWYAFGYGCTCNRDTLATINASGLRVEQVDHGEMPKAPPIVRPMIVGVAREVGAIGHQ
jgi:hypothetical protein